MYFNYAPIICDIKCGFGIRIASPTVSANGFIHKALLIEHIIAFPMPSLDSVVVIVKHLHKNIIVTYISFYNYEKYLGSCENCSLRT